MFASTSKMFKCARARKCERAGLSVGTQLLASRTCNPTTCASNDCKWRIFFAHKQRTQIFGDIANIWSLFRAFVCLVSGASSNYFSGVFKSTSLKSFFHFISDISKGSAFSHPVMGGVLGERGWIFSRVHTQYSPPKHQ